jgi:hypothetical protein
MLKKIISLLLISSAVQSNELNNLIDTSSAIVNQMDKGVQLVGAGVNYAYTGTGLTNGNAASSAAISSEMLQAYNSALVNMQNYLPYGSVLSVLDERASEQLSLMNDAVDTFTEVVVEMSQVIEVAEISEAAVTPDEQAEVQEFVANNQETLSITQEEVDTYNQSLDDIETHANAASAFIAVAANPDAVDFLQQGAENNNTTAEAATLSYSANNQWVSMAWAGTNNATAVYLNGNDNFGINLYVSDADALLAGSESEFYQDSPMGMGYSCFMYGDCSEY